MTDPEIIEEVTGEVVDEVAVVPYTGEALQLKDLPDEKLAQILDEAKVFEYETLRSFKGRVQAELLRRMDEKAEWTIHVPGYTLEGDSPERSEVDVKALQRELKALVDEGHLTQEVADKATREKKEIVVDRRGLKAVLKLGGEVRKRLAPLEVPIPTRRVRVTFKGLG